MYLEENRFLVANHFQQNSALSLFQCYKLDKDPEKRIIQKGITDVFNSLQKGLYFKAWFPYRKKVMHKCHATLQTSHKEIDSNLYGKQALRIFGY